MAGFIREIDDPAPTFRVNRRRSLRGQPEGARNTVGEASLERRQRVSGRQTGAAGVYLELKLPPASVRSLLAKQPT